MIGEGLNALLSDANLSRTLRDTPITTANLTIIVDEGPRQRAGAALRLAVARRDERGELWQAGRYAAALKSPGRSTAPGVRFARVATSTR